MQLYALLFLTHKYSLCTRDFLESDQLTRDCTLKKHSPYFPRSYQLHLRKEWDSIFRSLSMLAYYLVRASTGLVHAFTSIVSSYVNLASYVRETLFLCSHRPLLTFNISSPYFLQWCLGNRIWCVTYVHSTLSYSLHLCQMWVSVLITIYFKKNFLWWVLTNIITMDMKIIY